MEICSKIFFRQNLYKELLLSDQTAKISSMFCVLEISGEVRGEGFSSVLRAAE